MLFSRARFALFLAITFGLSASTPTLAQAQPTSEAPEPGALVLKAQRGELTLHDLIARLGSPAPGTRRKAALAVLALRDHYAAGARAVVERRYAGKAGALAATNALETSAFLRVYDPAIMRDAARHIGFSTTPPPVNSLFEHDTPRPSLPAAKLLVRAGYPALPALADIIASAPLPAPPQPTRGNAIALACAQAILGPATASWLRDQAAASTEQPRRVALENAARFVTEHATPTPAEAPGALALPGWATGLGLENVFDESYGVEDRAPIPLETYKIRWDAAQGLADEKTRLQDREMPGFAGELLPASTIARREIERTLRLLTINIVERLPSTSEHSSNDYAPFETGAQTDAVRLLGALRLLPQASAWKLWQRLLKVSYGGAVDEDTAPDTKVTLRALGQLGAPAAATLRNRIAHQSGPNQKSAAAYGLSQILGTYARDDLNAQIAPLQKQREAQQLPLAKDSYESSYQDMLRLGEEKQWFKNGVYGLNNPNAYDLTSSRTPEE